MTLSWLRQASQAVAAAPALLLRELQLRPQQLAYSSPCCGRPCAEARNPRGGPRHLERHLHQPPSSVLWLPSSMRTMPMCRRRRMQRQLCRQRMRLKRCHSACSWRAFAAHAAWLVQPAPAPAPLPCTMSQAQAYRVPRSPSTVESPRLLCAVEGRLLHLLMAVLTPSARLDRDSCTTCWPQCCGKPWEATTAALAHWRTSLLALRRCSWLPQATAYLPRPAPQAQAQAEAEAPSGPRMRWVITMLPTAAVATAAAAAMPCAACLSLNLPVHPTCPSQRGLPTRCLSRLKQPSLLRRTAFKRLPQP